MITVSGYNVNAEGKDLPMLSRSGKSTIPLYSAFLVEKRKNEPDQPEH